MLTSKNKLSTKGEDKNMQTLWGKEGLIIIYNWRRYRWMDEQLSVGYVRQ